MDKPFITVVMPVFNAERFLKEAIEGVLAQTYPNFELIIIDDVSKDRSWEIIRKYQEKDRRVKAYQNAQNLKIAKTREKGLSLAEKKAKYYAVADADDISLPERFEKEVAFLEREKGCAVCGSQIYIIDENSRKKGLRRYPVSDKELKSKIILFDPIAQPAAMIRIEALLKVGGYDEKFTGIPCEDYDLWLRIGKDWQMFNIDDFLLEYRVTSSQSKTTHLKKVLWHTIRLQLKWMFFKPYFNILAFPNVLAELALFLLPSKTVLRLFKKIRLQKSGN